MASASKVLFQSKQLDVEEEKVDTVSIRSTIDAKTKITGTVTGNLYIFNGAGAVINVDVRDKDELLNKKPVS